MSLPKLTGARYPIGSPSTSSPTCPSSKPWQKWSVRSVNSRSGNAVFRDPVTYSSTAAGDKSPSMSISPSRFFIRAGSSGSVRPSTQQTVIFVSDRLPTTDSSSRSSGVRRWRRIRLVFVRSVSVNASFAPLTVFSASGADGERFSPVFTSHPSAFPLFGKRITQNPFTSSSAASSVLEASFIDAHQTSPRAALIKSVSSRSSCRASCNGRTIKSAMSPLEVSPSRKKISSSFPPDITFRVSKSAAPANRAASTFPSTIPFTSWELLCRSPGKTIRYCLHQTIKCGKII